MREIKFRVWDKINKKMYNDIDLLSSWDDGYFIDAGEEWSDNQFIIMQYTGLKDGEDTEIYEGDIIDNPYIWTEDGNNIYGVVKFGECTVASGEYGAYGFYLKTNDGEIVRKELIKPNYVRDIEVKGNIYESPELLTKPTN